jgi:betaine reductase
MASQVLAHVPELVFVGSKPRRELERSPDLAASLGQALRSFDHAARYLPNQVFIGARSPRPLTAPERPWWQSPADEPRSETRSGALFTQGEFLAALSKIDTTGLTEVEESCSAIDGTADRGAVVASLAEQPHQTQLLDPVAIRGVNGDVLAKVGWGFADDEALSPFVALENLATKATAALALAHLLRANSIDPGSIDYVISCSEEAVGDRYQRGGGNMGKAVAESVGATRASGFDVKNFCAAPVSAMLVASSLVEAGVADRVAVVAGGSLPKLGMKFQGHLQNGMPILEDCLGGVAVLIGRDLDGPVIRYDAVGRHQVQAGSANAQILSNLVFDPLDRAGLKATDCGLFGTELHNPELTEPQGSGDVPMRNYRTIAALAVQLRHIDEVDIGSFLETRCLAGFAPTQGHIASAVCLLPNILDRMRAGSLRRAQLVAKGSLFLGRMTAMSDGMSLVLEN